MKKFIIERELPGAGRLSPEDLQAISQKSCNVLHAMGDGIQWLESFVAEDKIYCVYVATDKELLRQHAKSGGFPINKIAEVSMVIDPQTTGRYYAPGR
jgi:rRNA-processing protein FCF1